MNRPYDDMDCGRFVNRPYDDVDCGRFVNRPYDDVVSRDDEGIVPYNDVVCIVSFGVYLEK